MLQKNNSYMFVCFSLGLKNKGMKIEMNGATTGRWQWLSSKYQVVAAIDRKGWCDAVQGLCNGLENHRDQLQASCCYKYAAHFCARTFFTLPYSQDPPSNEQCLLPNQMPRVFPLYCNHTKTHSSFLSGRGSHRKPGTHREIKSELIDLRATWTQQEARFKSFEENTTRKNWAPHLLRTKGENSTWIFNSTVTISANNFEESLTHQWSSSDTLEVVQETFGVVDGRTENWVWFTPLAVQVLTVEIAAIPERSHRTWTQDGNALSQMGLTRAMCFKATGKEPLHWQLKCNFYFFFVTEHKKVKCTSLNKQQ